MPDYQEEYFDIVLDTGNNESPTWSFVEIEYPPGTSISKGTFLTREDGATVIRIPQGNQAEVEELKNTVAELKATLKAVSTLVKEY